MAFLFTSGKIRKNGNTMECLSHVSFFHFLGVNLRLDIFWSELWKRKKAKQKEQSRQRNFERFLFFFFLLVFFFFNLLVKKKQEERWLLLESTQTKLEIRKKRGLVLASQKHQFLLEIPFGGYSIAIFF